MAYVLLGSFVLVNLLIGVVINSLEEAREAEARQQVRADALKDEKPTRLREKTAAVPAALDDLEGSLPAKRSAERRAPVP
ncbi:hypothetical protein YWIDRAFT_06709 [Streptomyces sp. SceaMP-e96]|uniref:hypothetical protein n=1 Tax=unclassified Streptomyces TaxID=2593676 RepID=UPI000823AFCC|nr:MULTISPECIES: hypothetical protein [unclassified Streptomyces]MYT17111.1 hypothetical protein [Streptomyces sp. SID4951]SCK39823.1 hypothetical protein YWIDRAFT_06709 [Streptomyces sp. SceaMP-e96]